MAQWYISATGSDANAGTSTGAPYLTIGKGLLSAASGDTINVKAGTYTITATLVITQASLTIQGYQTTPGDGGTKPLITTATNSVSVFSTSSATANGIQQFDNLSLSNTAATRANGIWQTGAHGASNWWIFTSCVFDGFLNAINSDNGTGWDVSNIAVINTEIKNSTATSVGTGSAIISNTGALYLSGCYIHGGTGGAWQVQTFVSVTTVYITRSIISGGAGGGLKVGGVLMMDHSAIVSNTSTALSTGGGTSPQTPSILYNNIFYGNGAGIVNNANQASVLSSRFNAFGSNGSGNTAWGGSTGDVALSANPFTNSAAGDFSLNATAGGGAACKGAGFPGVFPGGLSTGAPDIGAVQTAATAASSGGAYTFAG